MSSNSYNLFKGQHFPKPHQGDNKYWWHFSSLEFSPFQNIFTKTSAANLITHLTAPPTAPFRTKKLRNLKEKSFEYFPLKLSKKIRINCVFSFCSKQMVGHLKLNKWINEPDFWHSTNGSWFILSRSIALSHLRRGYTIQRRFKIIMVNTIVWLD